MRNTIGVLHRHDVFSIVAVIVLYKMAPCEAPAFKTFMASVNRLKRESEAVKLLLYDNTPNPGNPGYLPPNVCYEAAGTNAGLAVAYNRALEIAVEMGASWLLLLDQDTAMPTDFLATLLTQIRNHDSNVEVAALVPIVRSGGIVSPKKVSFSGLRSLPRLSSGVQKAEMMSINSGAAIRCHFLISIGGFNCNYWLDYLDHWLFRTIYAKGKRAAIFNCVLEHSLSVRDYERKIDIARYRSILGGESAFITTHKPKVQIFFYLLRLFARAARMTFRGQSDLTLYTIATAKRILLHPSRSLERTYHERQSWECRHTDG